MYSGNRNEKRRKRRYSPICALLTDGRNSYMIAFFCVQKDKCTVEFTDAFGVSYWKSGDSLGLRMKKNQNQVQQTSSNDWRRNVE